VPNFIKVRSGETTPPIDAINMDHVVDIQWGPGHDVTLSTAGPNRTVHVKSEADVAAIRQWLAENHVTPQPPADPYFETAKQRRG
jgi:hypothetical protein